MMSELDRELLGVHVVYLPHYPYDDCERCGS